jgi:predicted DsbA family dithiol-disulfide isomerase
MSTEMPELWEWAEYYCPWCYISAVRLHKVRPEYEGRVRLRIRPVPLELHSDAAPRDILEQEWWLAALQEPDAAFGPMPEDWPTTTLPAFDAAWCANQQGEEAGFDYDMRVRRAFFAEGRNIGKCAILVEIAEEAGLDMAAFTSLLDSDRPREAVLAEANEGRERFKVRGTPTIMLADGTRLRIPFAYPDFKDRKMVGIKGQQCYGDECTVAARSLFEQALQQSPVSEVTRTA